MREGGAHPGAIPAGRRPGARAQKQASSAASVETASIAAQALWITWAVGRRALLDFPSDRARVVAMAAQDQLQRVRWIIRAYPSPGLAPASARARTWARSARAACDRQGLPQARRLALGERDYCVLPATGARALARRQAGRGAPSEVGRSMIANFFRSSCACSSQVSGPGQGPRGAQCCLQLRRSPAVEQPSRPRLVA